MSFHESESFGFLHRFHDTFSISYYNDFQSPSPVWNVSKQKLKSLFALHIAITLPIVSVSVRLIRP